MSNPHLEGAEKGLSVQACLELKKLILNQQAELVKKLDEVLLSKASGIHESWSIDFVPDSSFTHEDRFNDESEIIDLDVYEYPPSDDRTPEDCLEDEKRDSFTHEHGLNDASEIIDVDVYEYPPSDDRTPEDCPKDEKGDVDATGVDGFGPCSEANSRQDHGHGPEGSTRSSRLKRQGTTKLIMSESSAQLQSMTTWQRVISSTTYEICVMALVVANAIFMGWEMEAIARDRGSIKQDARPSSMEILFMICFATELCFRIAGDRHGFFFSTERYWNYFDLAAVAALIAEPFLVWLASQLAGDASSEFSMLRLLRIARLARLVRLIRVVRFFRELRLMLNSILGSFKSLLWVAIVLLLFLYIFAIALMGGTLDYLAREDAWEHESTEFLRQKFGSLPASVLSLYEAIAGGISWTELVSALSPLHPLYLVFFFLFQIVAMFAVLNIVTGIFVDSAMSYSQNDQETQIQDEIANKEAQAAIIEQIFTEVDADASGQVTLEELQSAIQDPRMEAYFAALGIRPHSLATLFAMLDADQTGGIELEEFLDGCRKYRGQASGLELAHVGRQVADIADHVQKILGQVGAEQKESLRANASWGSPLLRSFDLQSEDAIGGNLNANSIHAGGCVAI